MDRNEAHRETSQEAFPVIRTRDGGLKYRVAMKDIRSDLIRDTF